MQSFSSGIAARTLGEGAALELSMASLEMESTCFGCLQTGSNGYNSKPAPANYCPGAADRIFPKITVVRTTIVICCICGMPIVQLLLAVAASAAGAKA